MYWTFHILEGKFSNSFPYFLLIYILFPLKKKKSESVKGRRKINQAGLYVDEGLKKDPSRFLTHSLGLLA
jgi:hypothetical protein